MFTLEQINDIHDRLGNADTLSQYLEALKNIGVADTPPPLKGMGFGAMRAATLAHVKGSTPPKWSEIHDGLYLNRSIRSIASAGANITGSVGISMDHSATAGTGIDPSSWCILSLTLTITACACRIVFWDIASLHAMLG